MLVPQVVKIEQASYTDGGCESTVSTVCTVLIWGRGGHRGRDKRT